MKSSRIIHKESLRNYAVLVTSKNYRSYRYIERRLYAIASVIISAQFRLPLQSFEYTSCDAI